MYDRECGKPGDVQRGLNSSQMAGDDVRIQVEAGDI